MTLPMPLHLVKLCVGCDSVKELETWIRNKLRDSRKKGAKPQHVHVTRMVPKRAPELLQGGSLYWVIRGEVLCRQRLQDVQPFVDRDGIGRCRLVLVPKLIPTEPRLWRAFQGWRYLEPTDAPKDLAAADSDVRELPDQLRRELRQLGLL